MPNDWTRRLAAHGKRAAIVFQPLFPCEVRRMKLSVTDAAVARESGCYFSRGSSFEKAHQPKGPLYSCTPSYRNARSLRRRLSSLINECQYCCSVLV